MIDNDAPIFGRLVTAMVTPFTDDGEVDYGAVEKITEHLIASGTSTVLVCGTTGESPTLSSSEKTELLKRVLKVSHGRVKVLMGTGSNDTSRSVEASVAAENCGADGLLIVAPYYNKPSQSGIRAHVRAVAEKTGLPIVVYNIPGRTGINIAADTMLRIIEDCPTVHAIKDSTGGVDQSAQLARSARDDFRVYSGDDYMTLPFLSIGGCGVVSVASHLIGSQLNVMMDHFLNGRLNEARALHYKYLPLMKGLFAAPNPTCVKYALSRLGLCKDNLRLPLVALSDDEKSTMERLLDEAGLKAALSTSR